MCVDLECFKDNLFERSQLSTSGVANLSSTAID